MRSPHHERAHTAGDAAQRPARIAAAHARRRDAARSGSCAASAPSRRATRVQLAVGSSWLRPAGGGRACGVSVGAPPEPRTLGAVVRAAVGRGEGEAETDAPHARPPPARTPTTRLPKPRRPLLEERRHRLLVLRRLPALAQHLRSRAAAPRPGPVAVPLRERSCFDHAELRVRVGGDLGGEREGLRQEVVGRAQVIGETPRVRLGAGVEPAGRDTSRSRGRSRCAAPGSACSRARARARP